MKTLAVVPTRKGSKGLPGKNRSELGGRPLFWWALQQGRRTCDAVLLATDDEEQHGYAAEHGFLSYLSEREIGDDELPERKTQEALAHNASWATQFDVIVRLFATQPLRSDADIYTARALYSRSGRTVVGVSRASFRPHQVPGWVYRDAELDVLSVPNGARVPRQLAPEASVYINGVVYVASIRRFMSRGFWDPFVPSYVHPLRALDVDSEEDLRAVRALWPVRSKLWELRP